VTERFDGLAQQTIYGASGAGPAETVASLTTIGVGQGSGQTATKQEANSMIAFEFPIRWDDISGSLADLTDKKKLEQLVDDLTVRDNILEDYLNTNIVSGIVAGTNITIDRATGVVTISTTATPIPSGTIMQYGGAAAPTGWLLCDGTAYSTTTYAALYAILGNTYNTSGGQAAPAAGFFRVPLLTNRVPVGIGSGTFATLGSTGGAETHTIGTANLPPHQHAINHNHAAFDTADGGSHTHTITDPGHVHGYSEPNYQNKNMENPVDTSVAYSYNALSQNTDRETTGISINSTNSAHKHSIDVPDFSGSSGDGPGSSTAISNLQPYIVLNYIIKP
jgi:microcystin-dependent protein